VRGAGVVSVLCRVEELPRVLDSLGLAGVLCRRDDAARDVARIGLFQGRLGVVVVDVFLSEHPQYAEMHRRLRQVAAPDGRSLAFISAEDLCLHKLLFGRPKDIGDLESLFAVRTLDLAYVRAWLVQMVPAGDRRVDVFDDLARRFSRT